LPIAVHIRGVAHVIRINSLAGTTKAASKPNFCRQKKAMVYVDDMYKISLGRFGRMKIYYWLSKNGILE